MRFLYVDLMVVVVWIELESHVEDLPGEARHLLLVEVKYLLPKPHCVPSDHMGTFVH